MSENVCDICSAHGFPDFIVPFWVWKQITPTEDDGGILCPNCILKRVSDAGLTCEGALMSGPVRTVSPEMMAVQRELENVTLALKGRNNVYSKRLKP